MTFGASSRVYAPVSVLHRLLAIRHGKTSPVTSIIHLSGVWERQHGPIVLSHVSEDFNGSQSQPFFHSPQSPPCHAAIFCTDRQKMRTNSDIFQSVFLELGHDSFRLQDDLDIQWACSMWQARTHMPPQRQQTHAVQSKSAQTPPPPAHTHTLTGCMCLSCWLVTTEAELIQLQCLVLWSSWKRLSC